jgi:hypothetical protein
VPSVGLQEGDSNAQQAHDTTHLVREEALRRSRREGRFKDMQTYERAHREISAARAKARSNSTTWFHRDGRINDLVRHFVCPPPDPQEKEELLYEHQTHRLLSAHRFALRLLLNLLIASLIIGLSLLGGILGYEHFERLRLREAFSQLGDAARWDGADQDRSQSRRRSLRGILRPLFRLIFIVTAGVLLAPVVHRLLHTSTVISRTGRGLVCVIAEESVSRHLCSADGPSTDRRTQCFMGGLFLIIMAGILADTLVKIDQAPRGAPQLRAGLET